MVPGVTFRYGREVYGDLVGNRSQGATYPWDEAFDDLEDRRELLPLRGDLAGLVVLVRFL